MPERTPAWGAGDPSSNKSAENLGGPTTRKNFKILLLRIFLHVKEIKDKIRALSQMGYTGSIGISEGKCFYLGRFNGSPVIKVFPLNGERNVYFQYKLDEAFEKYEDEISEAFKRCEGSFICGVPEKYLKALKALESEKKC